ncbi:MAG TPA: T9SS type A sorting domain-containing protein, partial [Bacteroidales bacterium]|nr:T9SS type A sorting domain-containing protein [Bacteroidales bacterium]
DTITITVTNATQAGKLHWGVNNTGSNWIQPSNAYWPAGTTLFNGTGPAVETQMNGPAANTLTLKIGPFNNPVQQVTQVALVIHFDNNTWDNNNGQDFHIPINNNPTTAAHYPADNKYVRIYPNPFEDYCFINLSGSEWHTYTIEIFDLQGNKVQSLVMQKNVQKVERDFLKPGLYIIKVTDMITGEVFTDKVSVI